MDLVAGCHLVPTIFESVLSLFRKEVKVFLNSIIGYIVMTVFLVVVGLFMWVFPSSGGFNNVLEAGHSNIDGLFVLAPWVFLFLVPAVTMRSISEEKRTGTIELLLTQPITEWQIVLSKYLAGVTLVLFALVPTLLYYFSVNELGSPKGNIDHAAVWGSYLGLVFLASAFVGIGVFASSITSNQVISFIVAVFLCFICYMGFDSLSAIGLFGGSGDLIVAKLGISEHYASMSRGVLDSRDVIYFISLNALFLLLTKSVLSSRKW